MIKPIPLNATTHKLDAEVLPMIVNNETIIY